MNTKRELAQSLGGYLKKNDISYKEVSRRSDVTPTNVSKFIHKQTNVSFDYFLKMLDALNLKVVIEDKDADWGLDMRLRMLPRKLYVAERIEVRGIIAKGGFSPRVDLFESPEVALKFFPPPMDVYEIHPTLIRKKFDVADHPFGTMYSYDGWIDPQLIRNRVTYR